MKVFAINEEAYTFITGVNSNFEEYLKEYIINSNIIIIENIKNLLEKEDINDIDKIIDLCNISINEGYADLNKYINDYRELFRWLWPTVLGLSCTYNVSLPVIYKS